MHQKWQNNYRFPSFGVLNSFGFLIRSILKYRNFAGFEMWILFSLNFHSSKVRFVAKKYWRTITREDHWSFRTLVTQSPASFLSRATRMDQFFPIEIQYLVCIHTCIYFKSEIENLMILPFIFPKMVRTSEQHSP